jgi:apolipoprotein N-acyltransferase
VIIPSFSAPFRRVLPFLALLLGALNVFAFAPFGLWPLQLVTLALAFRFALHEVSFRRSALIGWAYGFGWMVAGIHWLYVSMHDYGGMPAWMAALAVVLLSLYLSLYTALALGLGNWLRRRWQASPVALLLLLFPALWALGDWLRGWVFTGFPWIVTGYAHNASPLAGYAPLVGVYGLALLAALVSGCLALLPSKKPVMFAILLLAAGVGLKSIAWTSPQGKPLTVRLLQGNVPQEMKFAPEQIQATLDLYRDMITSAPADLIVTPETAIPVLSSRLPEEYVSQLTDFARQSGSSLVLGLPVSDGPGRYANSVIGLSSGTPAAYRYDKHHLVPFGEFIPLGFRWFVDMMHIPLGDFTRGAPIQPPFMVKEQWVLPNICYEDLFGEEIAAQLAASRDAGQTPASILLNVSNIAWFGNSIALPQHLQISQMRSLETGRPMLRATNTGMTAVVNARGEVKGQLAPMERGTLTATVQGYTGLTPYSVLGNWTFLILSLLMLAAGWLLRNRRPASKSSQSPPVPCKTR